MVSKRLRFLLIGILMVGCVITGKSVEDISFFDDFEKGLGRWDSLNPDKIRIVESGNPQHGSVLALYSGGEAVYALIKDSHDWTNIRVEGDVFFPDGDFHHYLGFIYNYNVRGARTDFGSIFILGPYGDDFKRYYTTYQKYQEFPPAQFLGNVLLVNPHRDSNASRVLYTEYWVTLKGDSAVRPGEWHRFKAEVVGPVCHFYVDDMETPKITYDFFEFSSGSVGFKPRFAGAPCWVDNVRVSSIKQLSYRGPLLPAGIIYKPDKLITQWQVIGPFAARIKEIEGDGYRPEKSYAYGSRQYRWQPFQTDGRGCVVAGRVVERFSGKRFAYFHTRLDSDSRQQATLEFSSTNPLVAWVNGNLAGEIGNRFAAWYDFWENRGHEGLSIDVTLSPGSNDLVVLVKGGRYGGDGFYAYRRPVKKSTQE